MPKKEAYQLTERDKALREAFYGHLREGLPPMKAYTKTAEEFYLSEKRVRDIIGGR